MKKRLQTLGRALALFCGGAAGLLGLLAVKAALAILLCGALLLGLLHGCLYDHGLPHSRREVLAYLQTLCPGEDVSAARKHYEAPDPDHIAPLRVWDCWFDDMPEMVFQVTSGWYAPSAIPIPAGYELSDNLNASLWAYYAPRYQGPLDAWDDDLEMTFSDMEEVRRAAKQLEDFCAWYGAQPHTRYFPAVACGFTGGPLPLGSMEDRAWIRCTTAEGLADPGEVYRNIVGRCGYMLAYYYAFYNLPCPGYTPEEQEAFAEKTWLWYENRRTHYPYAVVLRNDSPENAALYPDLPRTEKSETTRLGEGLPIYLDFRSWQIRFQGIGMHYGKLSYGGLYQLLSRLGRDPEGTPEHFTAESVFGQRRYEFSYDFQDEAGWYYLLDGQACYLDEELPALRVNARLIEDLTGLWFQYS